MASVQPFRLELHPGDRVFISTEGDTTSMVVTRANIAARPDGFNVYEVRARVRDAYLYTDIELVVATPVDVQAKVLLEGQ